MSDEQPADVAITVTLPHCGYKWHARRDRQFTKYRSPVAVLTMPAPLCDRRGSNEAANTNRPTRILKDMLANDSSAGKTQSEFFIIARAGLWRSCMPQTAQQIRDDCKWRKVPTSRPPKKIGISKQDLDEFAGRDFELLQDHTCRMKYPDGLEAVFILEYPRFEVLFEMSAIAVTSFR